MPKNFDVISKRGQRQAIGRHGVAGEVTCDDLSKPFPCFRDGPVCSSLQRFLDFLELHTHAVAPRLPPDPEVAPSGFIPNEHEPQELEGLRFGEPALLAVLRRKAAELNQAGLVRMKRQRELPQPVAHRVPEAAGVALMLETDDKIVGVPDHDHVARSLAPSPALGPEIEDVVEVDVRKQRRNYRALPRPLFLYSHDPVFENAGP